MSLKNSPNKNHITNSFQSKSLMSNTFAIRCVFKFLAGYFIEARLIAFIKELAIVANPFKLHFFLFLFSHILK